MNPEQESGRQNSEGAEEKLSVALRAARQRLNPKVQDQRRFTIPGNVFFDPETAKLIAGVACLVTGGEVEDPGKVLKEVLVSLIENAVTTSDRKEIAKVPETALNEMMEKVFKVK